MSGGVFVQNMSLPSRECGLKYKLYIYDDVSEYVTPLAGVWIEICYKLLQNVRPDVTPLAGVWIEIGLVFAVVFPFVCHSPRGSVD